MKYADTVVQRRFLASTTHANPGKEVMEESEKKKEGGRDVCLATMLTSLTTAGPGSYAHTHTHTHTEQPNQYVTKEAGGVGDKLQKVEEGK